MCEDVYRVILNSLFYLKIIVCGIQKWMSISDNGYGIAIKLTKMTEIRVEQLLNSSFSQIYI